MSFEMTVGLVVVNPKLYSLYRNEMMPLLEEAGGRFRYDFEVARVLRSESDAEINRAFVLQFPNQARKERFFADARYLEIRSRLFEPAVTAIVLISEAEVRR